MTKEHIALPHDAESIASDDPASQNFISVNGTSFTGANHNVSNANDHTEDDDWLHDGPMVQVGTKPDDPFRYGWRYVERVNDDGTIEYDQIPLTLKDLLHPQEEDFRMQNPEHNETCFYLQTALSRQVEDTPTARVLYDVRIDWNVAGIKPFGPDITVIMETDIQPPNKGTFVAGEDGIPPIMVIEVTSPTTRKHDFDDKPRLMQQAGLPYYFVADLVRDPKKRKIFGYELTSGGYYIGIRPNEQGWVWMEPVDLWLGLRDGNVECYDPQGNLVLTYAEIAERLEAEKRRAQEADERANAESQRADTEAQRAQEADAENQRLVNYLRSLGIDPATIPK